MRGCSSSAQARPRQAPGPRTAARIGDLPPGRPAHPLGAIVPLARLEPPLRRSGGRLAACRPRRRGWPARVHSRPPALGPQGPAVPVASPAATSPASTRTGHHVSGSRWGQSSGACGAIFAPDAAHFAALPSPPPPVDCCKAFVSPLLAPLSGAAGSSPLGGICHNPLQSQWVAFLRPVASPRLAV